jgi:tRNA dimethylallyltransferase
MAGLPLIVIAGPTASGKSALALAEARARNGVLVNADASQLYRDLAILSARPGPAEEALAPHRLYGVLDGAEPVSVARWTALAVPVLEEAWRQSQLPILVGGTGLYLKALIDGIAPVPAVDPAVRAAVRGMTPAAVRAALEAEDRAMAMRLNPGDPQRNARALEVIRSTGRSLARWQAEQRTGGIAGRVALDARVVAVPRALLDRRIGDRITAMWRAGALQEARALAARGLPPTLPVMRAIGVPPLLAHLEGRLDEGAALERWRLDTRRYAKRQETWFRHQAPTWRRVPLSSGCDGDGTMPEASG